MASKEEKRKKLISVLKRTHTCNKADLESLKKEGCKGLARKDFIWHFLLQSLATWGRSKGADGLIKNKENYKKVIFEKIKSLDKKNRLKQIDATFKDAKLRMPSKKAKLLMKNFDLIIEMGGLEKAKNNALSQKDRIEKIKFLKQFHGIGDKYSRNIWMDVYHPDFHDSIAIDSRINKISKSLGYNFSNYNDHESFYLGIAKEAGLQGWEVDRLLYNFQDKILEGLKDDKD